MGRPSKSPERKHEIIGHFLKVVKEQGIEGASIAKIADSMGVPPSLIMHYYKTKDAMVIDLADYMYETNMKQGFERIAAISDSRERFDAILDMILARRNKSRDFRYFFPVMLYLISRSEKIRKKYTGNASKMHIFFIAEFTKFMDEGIIRRDDPSRLVSFLGAAGLGLAAEAVLGDFSDEDRNYSIDMIKRMIMK